MARRCDRRDVLDRGEGGKVPAECGEVCSQMFQVKYEAGLSTDQLVEKFNKQMTDEWEDVILRASVTGVARHLKWYAEIIDQREDKDEVSHYTFFATEVEADNHLHNWKVAQLDEEGVILAASSILDDPDKVDDLLTEEFEPLEGHRTAVQWGVFEVKIKE